MTGVQTCALPISINLSEIKNRKDAEDIFSNYVSDLGEIQFILKNLYRNEAGEFDWRINIPILNREIYQIGSEIKFTKKITNPALVIRGAESSYVTDQDFADFKYYFINAELVTVEGANHWIHASQPLKFVEEVLKFANA